MLCLWDKSCSCSLHLAAECVPHLSQVSTWEAYCLPWLEADTWLLSVYKPALRTKTTRQRWSYGLKMFFLLHVREHNVNKMTHIYWCRANEVFIQCIKGHPTTYFSTNYVLHVFLTAFNFLLYLDWIQTDFIKSISHIRFKVLNLSYWTQSGRLQSVFCAVTSGHTV